MIHRFLVLLTLAWLTGFTCGSAFVSCAMPAAAYENPECQWIEPYLYRCCNEHALAYMVGGTEKEREMADRALFWCMVIDGADRDYANGIVKTIRKFGGAGCKGKRCWRYVTPGGWHPAGGSGSK